MKLYIAPIGAYVGRVIRGIIELKPDVVYLLTHKPTEEGKSWGDFDERKFVEIKKQLGVTYEDRVHKVPTALEDYMNFFKTLYNIVEKEKDAEEIWINVTSTVKIPAFAALNLAALDGRINIFYVPRSRKLIRDPMKDYSKEVREDLGPEEESTVEIPVVRVRPLSEEMKVVLKELLEMGEGEHKQSELFHVLVSRQGWEKTKAFAMKLGRIVSRLESNGYVKVQFERDGKVVNLTRLGDAHAKVLR